MDFLCVCVCVMATGSNDFLTDKVTSETGLGEGRCHGHVWGELQVRNSQPKGPGLSEDCGSEGGLQAAAVNKATRGARIGGATGGENSDLHHKRRAVTPHFSS